MKTVLITGCSSGYGLATARHFHAQGWHVIASMRTPRDGLLPRSERLRLLALDVTKSESIAAALEASGPIDVLVNNAGIGLIGALEATPMAKARQIFETNTFGVMAMTQAVIPQFRARKSGVVVNVTSSVALAPMPLVSVYTASKTAIEGFMGAEELASPSPMACTGCPFTLICPAFWRGLSEGGLQGLTDVALQGTLETLDAGPDGDLYTADILVRCSTSKFTGKQQVALRKSIHGDLSLSAIDSLCRIVDGKRRPDGRIRADISTIVSAVSALPGIKNSVDSAEMLRRPAVQQTI